MAPADRIEPIEIPALCLVLLLGHSAGAKTTLLERFFKTDELVLPRSSGITNSAHSNLSADSFDWLARQIAARLERGLLTVLDISEITGDHRRRLHQLARKHYVETVAIVFSAPDHQVRRALQEQGLKHIFWVADEANAAGLQLVRVPSPTDRRTEKGPFDIIGDVHGCADELETMLERLGYHKLPVPTQDLSLYPWHYAHPDERKALFVGDLVDRGPRILDTVLLVRNMVLARVSLAVIGNHDDKFLRLLKGRSVRLDPGLQKTISELEALTEWLRAPTKRILCDFFDSLPDHILLDGGKLALAHAGVKPLMLGRDTPRVRDFALYGETHGETDEFGLPVRINWAKHYTGQTRIVYGHTPVVEAEWLNNTINIDTGCVFGGKLTALRYPELEIVSVPSRTIYDPPRRPIGTGMIDPPPPSTA